MISLSCWLYCAPPRIMWSSAALRDSNTWPAGERNWARLICRAPAAAWVVRDCQPGGRVPPVTQPENSCARSCCCCCGWMVMVWVCGAPTSSFTTVPIWPTETCCRSVPRSAQLLVSSWLRIPSQKVFSSSWKLRGSWAGSCCAGPAGAEARNAGARLEISIKLQWTSHELGLPGRWYRVHRGGVAGTVGFTGKAEL